VRHSPPLWPLRPTSTLKTPLQAKFIPKKFSRKTDECRSRTRLYPRRQNRSSELQTSRRNTPMLVRKNLWNGVCLRKALAFSTITLALLPVSTLAQGYGGSPLTDPVTYDNLIRITPHDGVKGDLAPIVRIVSPLADSRVAPGEARIGAGS